MGALRHYLAWEILAIHLLTGTLYALVNVMLALALVPDRWPVALAILPIMLFGWWGWAAEAEFVRRASRDLRRL